MYVLLFDDDCLMCNRAVQFLLQRDRGFFHFAALSSEYGQSIVKKHRLQQLDSVILVENDRVFTYSTAVLRAIRFIPKWRVLTLLRIMPKTMRDLVYKYVAKKRHKLKGSAHCLYLTPEQRTRFLQ